MIGVYWSCGDNFITLVQHDWKHLQFWSNSISFSFYKQTYWLQSWRKVWFHRATQWLDIFLYRSTFEQTVRKRACGKTWHSKSFLSHNDIPRKMLLNWRKMVAFAHSPELCQTNGFYRHCWKGQFQWRSFLSFFSNKCFNFFIIYLIEGLTLECRFSVSTIRKWSNDERRILKLELQGCNWSTSWSIKARAMTLSPKDLTQILRQFLKTFPGACFLLCIPQTSN